MNKLVECISNRDSSYLPIWFMRQAGRYLPEFKEIRIKNPNFINLCLNSELAAEITIQPIKRFDLDAAIIFSDILLIPYGLGQKVEFKKGEGPVLGDLKIEEILKTTAQNFLEKVSPVYKVISKVKEKLPQKSVIGFVGAPWTLLVYMLNQKSPKKDFDFFKVIKNEKLTQKLLAKLEDMISLHINEQIKAGADVIQIFDSWAGLLPKNQLFNFCYNPSKNIIDKVNNKKKPIICFPRGLGKEYAEYCEKVSPHCISIDYDVDPQWAKNNLKGIPIQGGMDPKILLKDENAIKKEVEKYLNIFSGYPYIFNLGHGVLPDTKPETIRYITNLVRKKR